MDVADRDLVKKLGIRPGDVVATINPHPEVVSRIREGLPPGAVLTEGLPPGVEPATIIFWPGEGDGLYQALLGLQGAITVVGAMIPRKEVARRRGVDITFERVQAEALRTDLVDNKVASVSPEEYAVRFVIRRERRPPGK